MTGPVFILLAQAEKLPDLRPPESLLTPSLWERCGGTAGWGALVLLVVAVEVWYWRRRWCRNREALSPMAVARAGMQELASLPEDGALAGRVARVVRVYLVSALPTLPQGELTAEEIAARLPRSAPWLGAELLAGVIDFLRECDRRKYGATNGGGNLVARAGELLSQVETKRAEEALRVPPVLKSIKGGR